MQSSRKTSVRKQQCVKVTFDHTQANDGNDHHDSLPFVSDFTEFSFSGFVRTPHSRTYVHLSRHRQRLLLLYALPHTVRSRCTSYHLKSRFIFSREPRTYFPIEFNLLFSDGKVSAADYCDKFTGISFLARMIWLPRRPTTDIEEMRQTSKQKFPKNSPKFCCCCCSSPGFCQVTESGSTVNTVNPTEIAITILSKVHTCACVLVYWTAWCLLPVIIIIDYNVSEV